MNITNLPKANEIYNQVREYQGKLTHLRSDSLVIKVEIPKPREGNNVNNETITIHEFKKSDAAFDHILMDLNEQYNKKIEELKREFKEL